MTKLATITPTAIDAYISIEWVRVVGRHRKDLGDLQSLAASIADVDLLNPITVTRDGRLIAGQRRLEACRLLGWSEIPVRFADTLDDAAKLLRAERDENTCREDMRLSELASLGAALDAIEEQEAKERQREGNAAGGRGGHQVGGASAFDLVKEHNATRAIVGEALGLGSRTYQDLRSAYKLANNPDVPEDERQIGEEALADMDRTGHVKPAADKMRRRLRARRDAKEAKAAAMAPEPEPTVAEPAEDADWIPAGGDSSRRATARRRDLIRELGAQGWSSGQIAQHIGILDVTVRRIARDHGIPIPADEALGRRVRQTIDSNRIVRETVQDLEGLMPGLDLIRFSELDSDEIQNWTASLSHSIRRLNRLNKELKEMVQ